MAAASSKAEHRPFLEALGGIAEERLAAVDTYLSLVADWNQKTNLTGALTAAERVRVLVADPHRAAPGLAGGSLVDIGSGNGSPGLVLAILRPDLRTTLLEPRARRWAFLREATRRLGRLDVGVERARCEEYRGPGADSVTLRGLDLPVDVAGRLALEDGEILYFGGEPMDSTDWERADVRELVDSKLWVFRRRVSRETPSR
jgi:16S rRNA (guanine(527)-N(7))-methyltransferase RsmG